MSETGAPVLQIRSDMSLEQAMAEVRKYLHAKAAMPEAQPQAGADGSSLQPRQFAQLGSSIARLSQLAARQGEVDRNSRAGIVGSYLKRIIGKTIGWYSRPVYEFNRTAVDAFEQTRLDLQGLQQQIQVLAAERKRQSEQTELLRSVIELLMTNIATVQSMRQALQNERSGFQEKFEELLNTFESELAVVKTTLLEQLPPGPAQNT